MKLRVPEISRRGGHYHWRCRQNHPAIHDMINVLSIFYLALQVSVIPPFVTAFTGATIDQKLRHVRLQQKRQESSSLSSSSSTHLKGTLSWSGDANASIDISDTSSRRMGLSIRDWLDDPHASNRALLGSSAEDFEEQTNGTILCRQPPVDFLGMVLRPIFWNKISRPMSGKVTVTIIDAQTEVGGTSSGGRTANIASQALRSIMKESKFHGRSIIQAHDDDNNKLSVDLKLTLKVTLPPYLLVPPGFNSLGSAIIKRTGQSRSQKLLRDLQREYRAWVQRRKKEEKEMIESPPIP
jgi:hypothetical protein